MAVCHEEALKNTCYQKQTRYTVTSLISTINWSMLYACCSIVRILHIATETSPWHVQLLIDIINTREPVNCGRRDAFSGCNIRLRARVYNSVVITHLLLTSRDVIRPIDYELYVNKTDHVMAIRQSAEMFIYIPDVCTAASRRCASFRQLGYSVQRFQRLHTNTVPFLNGVYNK